MSSIADRQNEPRQLQRLAAQRQLYSTAKAIIGIQLVLSVPIAVLLAFLGLGIPAMKGYVATWGIVVVVIDVVLIAWQKKLQESAAKIQEAFDCDVLSLPWNELKAGEKPTPELISEYSAKYGARAANMPPLENWYPMAIQQLPLEWGRIVCQRVNCWWDAKLRTRYANVLLALLLLLTICSIWIAIAQEMSLGDFFIKVVAPLSPTFTIGIKQLRDHRDAASRLDKLRTHAEKLWKEALSGQSVGEMSSSARVLQDEILEGRRRNPPIFDALFSWLRNRQESQMNFGAAELIAEAKKFARK